MIPFDSLRLQPPVVLQKGFASYDISQIWNLTFGYTGLPFPGDAAGYMGFKKPQTKTDSFELKNKAQTRVETSDHGARLYAIGDNGREIFMPLWMGETEKDKILFPVCVVGNHGQKKLIETPLTGRRGAVIEDVCCENYQFHLQGLCVGWDYSWPEKQIAMLRDLYEKRKSLFVEHALIDVFVPEHKIIIKSLDIKECRGVKHVQGFDMTIMSDESFELTLD